MKKDVYQIITDKVIEGLKSGNIAWQKEWSGGSMPQNLISKKAYNGINVFLLTMQGFDCAYWLTYNQAKKLGGSVKKGAKGTPIVFWDIREEESDRIEGTVNIGNHKPKTYAFLRYYTVFNALQCDNIKIPENKREFNPIEEAEKLVEMYQDKPIVEYTNEGRAYFRPTTDELHMPQKSSFKSEPAYYSTLFHELTHSTGAKKRLDRWSDEENKFSTFGDKPYSKEELIAELGSAFLCAKAGISNKVIENQQAYINGWLRALTIDKKLIITASGKAQKAVKYMEGQS